MKFFDWVSVTSKSLFSCLISPKDELFGERQFSGHTKIGWNTLFDKCTVLELSLQKPTTSSFVLLPVTHVRDRCEFSLKNLPRCFLSWLFIAACGGEPFAPPTWKHLKYHMRTFFRRTWALEVQFFVVALWFYSWNPLWFCQRHETNVSTFSLRRIIAVISTHANQRLMKILAQFNSSRIEMFPVLTYYCY